MSTANLDHTYSLVLSSGSAWQIGPCEGVDAGVCAWVDEFAANLGLESTARTPARGLRFGRVRDDNGRIGDSYPIFSPSIPPSLPPDGWHVWGRAGVVLMRHPEVADVFCGLYPYLAPMIEPMRHALIPILEETISSGGLPLHGALLECRGAGVLLLGKGGTGKTTCCGRLPSHWFVHGDDMALAVRDTAGRFLAHPLPTWSAVGAGQVRWPCRVNRAVPLRALIILEQSPEDGVVSLGKSAAAVAVEKACVEALEPFYLRGDRRGRLSRRNLFDNAMALAGDVPAFRLRVSLEGRFWGKIEDAIGKTGQRSIGNPVAGCRETENTSVSADGFLRDGWAA
jgi:SynChlorMet cassette protein ScmC